MTNVITETITQILIDWIIFQNAVLILNDKPKYNKVINLIFFALGDIAIKLLMYKAIDVKLPAIAMFVELIIIIIQRPLFFSILLNRIDKKMIYIGFATLMTNQMFITSVKFIAPSMPDYAKTILATAIEIFIIAFLMMYVKKKNRLTGVQDAVSKIPAKTYIILLLSLWIFIMYLTASNEYYGKDAIIAAKIKTLLTIPMFFMVAILVAYVVRIKFSEEKNVEISNILSKQIEGQIGYYEKLISISDELHSFRHDFKNHLLCLSSLLDSGNTEQAIEYINEITVLSAINKNKFNTGNVIINALLNDKEEKVANKNISFEFSGIVPTTGISNSDLCIIFSNAIDNAVEACLKSETDFNKVIKIESVFSQGYYFIKFKNPVFEQIKIKNSNQINTTKKDKKLHGYGLSNIIRVVRKYNGTTTASINNNVFLLDVELQLNKDLS